MNEEVAEGYQQAYARLEGPRSMHMAPVPKIAAFLMKLPRQEKQHETAEPKHPTALQHKALCC